MLRGLMEYAAETATTGVALLAQIKNELGADPYYLQNYKNDGERFVAWYLRRVLARDPIAAKDAITDGKDDKQFDAIIVDDDEQRVLVIQGKFIDEAKIDSGPLGEVLSAWLRL